jgi:hypothetical protein
MIQQETYKGEGSLFSQFLQTNLDPGRIELDWPPVLPIYCAKPSGTRFGSLPLAKEVALKDIVFP